MLYLYIPLSMVLTTLNSTILILEVTEVSDGWCLLHVKCAEKLYDNTPFKITKKNLMYVTSFLIQTLLSKPIKNILHIFK